MSCHWGSRKRGPRVCCGSSIDGAARSSWPAGGWAAHALIGGASGLSTGTRARRSYRLTSVCEQISRSSRQPWKPSSHLPADSAWCLGVPPELFEARQCLSSAATKPAAGWPGRDQRGSVGFSRSAHGDDQITKPRSWADSASMRVLLELLGARRTGLQGTACL